jgi:hypothetical protein
LRRTPELRKQCPLSNVEFWRALSSTHFAMPGSGDGPRHAEYEWSLDRGFRREENSASACKVFSSAADVAALDRHPIVAEILSDRAAAISRDPARDVFIS